MKLLKKDYPNLFEDIGEFIIEDSAKDHRRDDSFYTKSIVEFQAGDFIDEMSIADANSMVGYWETNMYIRSDSYVDWDDITELTKVKKVTKEVVKKEVSWEED